MLPETLAITTPTSLETTEYLSVSLIRVGKVLRYVHPRPISSRGQVLSREAPRQLTEGGFPHP